MKINPESLQNAVGSNLKIQRFATLTKVAVPLCQLHASTSARKWTVNTTGALCFRPITTSKHCPNLRSRPNVKIAASKLDAKQVAQKYRCKATAHLHSLNASRCAGHSPSCLAGDISLPLSLKTKVQMHCEVKRKSVLIKGGYQMSPKWCHSPAQYKLAQKFPRLSWPNRMVYTSDPFTFRAFRARNRKTHRKKKNILPTNSSTNQTFGLWTHPLAKSLLPCRAQDGDFSWILRQPRQARNRIVWLTTLALTPTRSRSWITLGVGGPGLEVEWKSQIFLEFST